MTEPYEFEETLKDGLQDATRNVVAAPDVQRRLIDNASAAPARRRWARPLHARRPSARWALPSAAALITLLTVGSVFVGQHLTDGSPPAADQHPVVADTITTLPDGSTPAEPSSSLASATPTSQARTSAAATAPAVVIPTGHAAPTAAATSSRASVQVVDPPATYPARCSTPITTTYTPTSTADFTQHIIGTWLVCSHPTVFATDEDGLAIRADGHWAKLNRDDTGTLIAATLAQDSGTWRVLDVSEMNGQPMWQLNLENGFNGTVITLAVLSADGQRVHLNNMSTWVADYVLAA